MFQTICHFLGAACTLVVLVLLPASNQGLPFSTHFWLLPLSAAALLFLTLARLSLKPWQGLAKTELQYLALPAGLLGYGWLLTLCPSGMMDQETGTLLAFDSESWRAFGSLDQSSSARAMMGITTLAMLFVCVSLLATKRSGRIAIASAITLAGVITAVIGLWLQTNSERSWLWREPHIPSSVFGLFWYHGSAAAFLNLAWPWAAWLFLVTKQARLPLLLKNPLLALMAAATLVQWIAVGVNVSKMGHMMMLCQIGALLAGLPWLVGRRERRRFTEHARHSLWIGAALVLAMAGAWVTGASQGWMRWGAFSKRGFDDPARRHATSMALRIGNESGWTGTGPGTFEIVSPHYSVLDSVIAGGHWRHAHNDYAQFYAEWGGLGVVLLLVLLVPPVFRLFQVIVKAFKPRSHEQISYHRLTACGCLLPACAGMLVHACVDFPFQIEATQGLFSTLVAVVFSLAARSHGGPGQRYTSVHKAAQKSWLAPFNPIDHSFFDQVEPSCNKR